MLVADKQTNSTKIITSLADVMIVLSYALKLQI